MLELSIFADESGDKSDHAKYYLLTLVFHNQADSIIDQVMTYERSLADADLPNIAFHSEPLMNGHKDYVSVSSKIGGLRFIFGSSEETGMADVEPICAGRMPGKARGQPGHEGACPAG